MGVTGGAHAAGSGERADGSGGGYGLATDEGSGDERDDSGDDERGEIPAPRRGRRLRETETVSVCARQKALEGRTEEMIAQARRKARGAVFLGACIAELRIPADAPARFERTRGPGHHTFWVEPVAVLAWIVSVVPVEGRGRMWL